LKVNSKESYFLIQNEDLLTYAYDLVTLNSKLIKLLEKK